VANLVRGEIEAELGGSRRRMCLTLGALAELEAALGADDLQALAARFEGGRFSARDLTAIIGAGLRGAGADIDDAAVAGLAAPGGAGGYVDIVARLLRATFAPSSDGESTAGGAEAAPGPKKR
jgi:hypothetical protein